ncbi:MAG: cation transporter [Gemmatimonadetes bacterium]|nr:cation transporter [Gemmatimonadota bacterium]
MSSGFAADARERWARRGLQLVGATMAYNALEAAVALWAGLRARSIALLGFGLDSVIEIAAAGVVFWRVAVEARGAARPRVEGAERRVRRFVGLTFLLLAGYVVLYAIWSLWAGAAPSESLAGIVLAVASLVVMPLIAMGKFRVAEALGSGSLRAEAKETLACSYLSFCLLFGLAANALARWWWADPAAALFMVPWLVWEGIEGLE